MRRSYENALYVAKKCGWNTVLCAEGDRIRTRGEIHNEILEIIRM